jgi:isocitrate/isopropylmalate dehydrogenase
MTKRIAGVPVDEIGIDGTAEAVKVLETLLKSRALPVELVTFDSGAEKFGDVISALGCTASRRLGISGFSQCQSRKCLQV